MEVASGRPLTSGTMVCSWALASALWPAPQTWPRAALAPLCCLPQPTVPGPSAWVSCHSSQCPTQRTHMCLYSRIHVHTEGAVSLSGTKLYLNFWLRTCLVVQWLRLRNSNAGGTGLIPDRGTMIPHAAQCSQKLKKKKNRTSDSHESLTDLCKMVTASTWISGKRTKLPISSPGQNSWTTSFSAFTDILDYSTW